MKHLITRKYDNYILFFSLVSIMFLMPFINAVPLLRFALAGQYSFVMFYLIFSSRHAPKLYMLDIAFVLPTLLATWVDSIFQNTLSFVISYITIINFFIYLQVLSITQIVHSKKVETNTIFGAMNIYIIAGLIWAYVFVLLQHFDPTAFHMPAYEAHNNIIEVFTYYSFVTLTTLGFGDIVATSSQARMLSVLEAIFGQLYLAIVIAKLVSISMHKER